MLVASAGVEITDLLWAFDGEGNRQDVARDEVAGRLARLGQRRAARIVRRLPTTDGVLDAAAVDALALRVHCELLRLAEELLLGRRVADHIGPVVQRLRRERPTEPVRVVDIGCGLGYVVRWLAQSGALGPGVELFGVDLNPVFAAAARELAAAEALDCEFVHGDAFEPGTAIQHGPRTVVISSGLMHHLPAPELPAFFAAQERLGVAAFAHWDIVPSRWSTLGAWVFHRARMREPVSRHDGVLSARRAHPAPVLVAAAAAGALGYLARVVEESRWHPRALDVLRPLVGTAPR